MQRVSARLQILSFLVKLGRTYDLIMRYFCITEQVQPNPIIGDRSFTAAAPESWNSLPDCTRTENNLNSFKVAPYSFMTVHLLMISLWEKRNIKEQRQNTGKCLSFFRYSVAMTTSYSEELTTNK